MHSRYLKIGNANQFDKSRKLMSSYERNRFLIFAKTTKVIIAFDSLIKSFIFNSSLKNKIKNKIQAKPKLKVKTQLKLLNDSLTGVYCNMPAVNNEKALSNKLTQSYDQIKINRQYSSIHISFKRYRCIQLHWCLQFEPK